MIHQRLDTFTARQIRALVQPDFLLSKTEDELRQRLFHKGYGLKRTQSGLMLTAEPHNVPLFALTPDQLPDNAA